MLELDRCFLCSYSWFLRSVSFVIFTGSYSKDKSKNVAQNEQRINVLVNPGLNVYVGFGVVKCRGKYFGSCWKEIFISSSPGLSVGWIDGTMHQVN